jgi:hypothetical protein
MKNIQMSVKDDVLTITVKLSERHGKSASGKTTVIASTLGNKPVPGYENIVLGVNAYTKSE